MKTFDGDFDFILNNIKNKKNFGLSRFGDGELMIIEGNSISLLNKGIGEFEYVNCDAKYDTSRKLLTESLKFIKDGYYVGIGCKCCIGSDKHYYIKNLSKQPESNLTWANIFVNSNYNRFLNELLPEFKNRCINLICHESSNTENLPFSVNNIYKIKTNAWLNNLDLIDVIKNDIINKKMVDNIFLISAGPFAKILTYKLYEFNDNNTYLDIGSTMDKIYKLPATRKYLNGGETLYKRCIW
jgi:hypothetical protein